MPHTENKNITQVCIAVSNYALLLYLLLFDEDTVANHTAYFFSDTIDKNIARRLNARYYKIKAHTWQEAVRLRLRKLQLRFFKYAMFPYLKTADIYALDLGYLSLLIGSRNYSLLSDAPDCLTMNMQSDSPLYVQQRKHAESFTGKLQRLIFGDVFVDFYGNNHQCTDIYLGEENFSSVLEGKRVHIQSLRSLWDNADDSHRRFVLNVFDFSEDDMQLLRERPILFFTQPLAGDFHLSDEEYSELLQRIFSHYPQQQLLIKIHPRDKFEYGKYFPDLPVFSKVINSQLMTMCGVVPKRAVTVFSSAVFDMPDSTEVDFYGPDIHPKIAANVCSVMRPKRKYNKVNL